MANKIDRFLESSIGKVISVTALLYFIAELSGITEEPLTNLLIKLILFSILASALAEWLILRLKDFFRAFKGIYDIRKLKQEVRALKKKVKNLELQVKSMNKKAIMPQLGYIVFILIIAIFLYFIFTKLA